MVQLSDRPRTARLRADASRNRERILAAAEDAFVEFGADVPLDEIARRAGVGNATLYRHFADRRALVHGVVVAVMAKAEACARAALAEEPDAFAALSRFVHASVDWSIGALCPMITKWTDLHDPELDRTRRQLTDAIGEIVTSAQAAGILRPDVTQDDILFGVSQLVRPPAGAEANPYAHRQLQLLLDGLRHQHTELPGEPADFEELRGCCKVPAARLP
ncbi:TetR/AcrR family transcriptional regulator [Streptacidiphilus monticola]|jgi:AcrR family transcriptional regulator|uniref:TetR/AcrR family transcriptional regulator n=1 Tax=Streptacidiphilus monticola TaxID=2161674 RepID=A0ABW1G5L9_9ACTN